MSPYTSIHSSTTTCAAGGGTAAGGTRAADAACVLLYHVAINGMIIADADYEDVPPDAEVHFLDIYQGG